MAKSGSNSQWKGLGDSTPSSKPVRDPDKQPADHRVSDWRGMDDCTPSSNPSEGRKGL